MLDYQHWKVRYCKELANGGEDRAGQWVVIVSCNGRLCDRYFPDEASADAFVANTGLEGEVPIFPVPAATQA